jgi:hypothetical protein
MKTHTINISTKKGEIQLTRWIITQTHPHPDTEGHSGEIKWRNAENLFDRYNQPASGIGQCYQCSLTIPADEIPDNYDRTHFAGFVPYAGYGKPANPPNAGTFTIRGRDLGEVQIEIKEGSGWQNYTSCNVNGGDRPTPQEKEIIEKQIVPILRAIIERDAAELHAAAVARLKATFAEQVARVRASANRLEKEAAEALAKLAPPVAVAA